LLSWIAAEGTVDVYEAHDQVLGRHVALRVLSARFASDPAMVARFEQDAKAAASTPPEQETIYDYGVDEGIPYLASHLPEDAAHAQRLDMLVPPARLVPEATHPLSRIAVRGRPVR